MTRIIATALCGLFLASCAGAQAQFVDRAQNVSDDAARGLVAAPCAMTVGAYNRLPQHQRIAVDLLCGGNALRDLQGLTAPPRP